MQATYELKPFPFQVVAFVCGLLAAAVIGGAGGSWLKGLDRPGSAATATVIADRLPSMVGGNAVAEATIAQQPSLVGETGRVEPTAQKLREGHRR